MEILSLLLEVVYRFLDIILAPIKNPDLLWVIFPIYLVWFTTEYFQEKKETSFGNAATNGTIIVWVSLDWLRQMITRSEVVYNSNLIAKVVISIFLLLYGIFVICEAIRGRPVAKHLGRVKDISYFQITLTPVMYDVVQLDFVTILAILFFYPIIRILTLIIDKVLPEPPYEKKEENKLTFSESMLYEQEGGYNYYRSSGSWENYDSSKTFRGFKR